ncbi:MAG: secretin N-terminal domain-containing protein [Phycisphaerales bacterium]
MNRAKRVFRQSRLTIRPAAALAIAVGAAATLAQETQRARPPLSQTTTTQNSQATSAQPGAPSSAPKAVPWQNTPNGTATAQPTSPAGTPNLPKPPSAPGAQPGAAPVPGAPAGDALVRENADAKHEASPDQIELSAFSAPVELSALVDMLVKQLNINVAVKGNLTGQVSFNAPVSVPRDRFLPLVNALLEQQGFTITHDSLTGFYLVHPINEVAVGIGGDAPSTRVIPTPNVRPSALKPAIEAQFGGAGAGGAMPGGAPSGGVTTGSGALGQAAYIDELGVIVLTGSPRRLEAVESLVRLLLDEYARAKFIRLELKYVAASIARERALQLIGQSPQTSSRQNANMNNPGDPGNPGGGGGRATTLDNLADRLTIDPTGNALIFRGVPDEVTRVRDVLSTIDAPSGLTSVSHYVGTAARQIADLAKQRGLGDVTTIASTQSQNNNQVGRFFNGGNDPSQRNQSQSTVSAGGPVMVVDEDRGTIVYYATDQQHKLLEELIKGMNLEDDVVVVKEYKLRFASAESVAEIVNGLLTNTTPAGDSSLLPGSSGSSSSQGSSGRNTNPTRPSQPQQPSPTVFLGPNFGGQNQSVDASGIGFSGGNNVFVLADKPNNQVLVKAPQRQQAQFAALIERIDLRRPQVYISAKIVAVTAADDFSLSFETQVTNLFGEGLDINTAFGLSTLSNIGTAKTVATGLTGLTAAVVKSSYVPIIIHALETTTDTRIMSEPSLMVNDNEKAKIERVDQQPTTTSNQGTSTTSTTFAGYEDAGTDLEITPRISGNLVTLEIVSNLSAFEGTGSNGIPPPRNKASIDNKAVTVPSDMTVVIGGITLGTRTDTIRKLPLLGDIPLVGYLFRDTQKISRKTVLYIFITPRIVQDPNFEDLRLLTTGPQKEVEVAPDLPRLKPVLVDFFVPHNSDSVRPDVSVPINVPPLPPAAPAPGPIAPPPEPTPTAVSSAYPKR